MHHRHVAGDVGEIQRFFERGVTAAYYGNFLPFVEKPVAGGAARYAFAHEFFFRRQAQVHGGCAGGDDQCVTGVGGIVADQGNRRLFELGGVNLVENDFGVEALSVL